MTMKRRALAILVVSAGLVAAGSSQGAWAGDFATPQWAETRKALFQDRPIQEDAEAIVQLDVPVRPDDAAAVPILIKVRPPNPRERAAVKNLYVVIDRNPEPLAGVF